MGERALKLEPFSMFPRPYGKAGGSSQKKKKNSGSFFVGQPSPESV